MRPGALFSSIGSAASPQPLFSGYGQFQGMQQVPPPQPQQQDFMGMMKEAAVRGDQKAMEMMVYFKKKEMESAAEAEMGDEIAALRKQLEKLEFKKLAVVTTDEPTTHTGRSTSHEWWCLNSTSRALG